MVPWKPPSADQVPQTRHAECQEQAWGGSTFTFSSSPQSTPGAGPSAAPTGR